MKGNGFHEKSIYYNWGKCFLGNNIIRKLNADSQIEIRALVLPNDSINSLANLNCQIYYGDVTKKDTLKEIFVGLENKEVYVIHCAAIVYIKSKNDKNVYEVNVNKTKNIVDKVLDIKAKLVYVSSVHAINEKKRHEVIKEITDFDKNQVVGLYAKTKSEAVTYVLKMVKEKNLNACVVHPSGIIGPYDFKNSHLTHLINVIANRKLFVMVKGGYDFVDVRDVAQAIIKSCSINNKKECYILSNRYITMKELADIVREIKKIRKSFTNLGC